MDLNIQKFNIKLKSKPIDGMILQLHHTVRGPKGELRRIRFSTGAFDNSQEKLVCVDTVGSLFILDFNDLKFWKLTGFGPCSAIQFIPNKLDTVVAGFVKSNDINIIDIETGNYFILDKGHSAPVKHISFNKTCNMLSASPAEAILWNLTDFTKHFTLNTFNGAPIQQIMYTPTADYLVACFQNDTIQIWKNNGMTSVKQIIPIEIHHLKSIAFTMNGRAMAMAGLSSILILFSMDTWKPINTVDLQKHKITGIHQIAFIPQPFDGGANKVLAILSSDCTLYLFNLETSTILHAIRPEISIKKFVVSPTGKYFFCLLKLGEINIYNSSFIMEPVQHVDIGAMEASTSRGKYSSKCVLVHKTEIEKKMRMCMDSTRLRRILTHYGEYPEKFRSTIWKSLLDTPRNKSAYSALVNKGIHVAFKDIEKQFTIHSTASMNSLKRLLSCLAHWCPLFGVMKFIPSFIFPFVRVLQTDPLLLFECVATVLVNHCQLWFEYAPFPPITVLAMIENILAEEDPHLLNHYIEMGVTSQDYALKILETAFSEVLTCSDWLVLWDHILSNEPAFLIMAVVSYNLVQKNVLKKFNKYEQFENFFHSQNPVDKKVLLKRTYMLMNDTPLDIHPKKFFNNFVSLEKGDCYQQFTEYPKATICLKLPNKDSIQKSDSKQYSLKQLTKMSQESIIQKNLRVDKSSDPESILSEEEGEMIRKEFKKISKNKKNYDPW